MQNTRSKIVLHVLCFAGLGGLIGFLQQYMAQHPSNLIPIESILRIGPVESAFTFSPLNMLSVLAITLAALASWRFRYVITFARAGALCLSILIGWVLLDHLLGNFLTSESSTVFLKALKETLRGIVESLAMFAYIMRALIARSRGRAAFSLLPLGAAVNLLLLAGDQLGISDAWLTIGKYALLLGVTSFLSHLTSRAQFRTRVVELE